MTASHHYPIQIEIAGLRVTLSVEHSEVARLLRQEFAAYQPDPGTQPRGELQLEVHLQTPASQAYLNLDAHFDFRGGVLYFENPGYNGWIDESHARGELDLASAYPVPDINYYIRTAFALLAYQQEGLLFHSAGIVSGGVANLFFGHSGSGKTTASRLAGERPVLNDDLLILMPENGRWVVHGTPFSNPTQVAPSTVVKHAPLQGLYRLVQDRSVFRQPIPRALALAEMVSNTPVIPADPGRGAGLLARLGVLLNRVPAYYLHFLPDNSFWECVEQPERSG